MKKLVIKTTLITLACLIGALVITISALCLFAPATMAGFFDDVGNYSASVFFYEKQYEKTGDIEDLDKLILKVDMAGDTVRTEKYVKQLIEHKDFNKFLMADREYYYGCYALSLARNGKFDDAVKVGQDFVSENGYTALNPLRVLITDFVTDNMTEQKVKLALAITQTTNVSIEQNVYKVADLIKLS